MQRTVSRLGREEPPLSSKDVLELSEPRVAREVSTYLEPEVVDLRHRGRRGDLVHHPIERRADVPRIVRRYALGARRRNWRERRD